MTENQPPDDFSAKAVLRTLLVQISRGKINAAVALPVIARLVGEEDPDLVPSVEKLIDALAPDSGDEEVRALVDHLRELQLLEIAKSRQVSSPPPDDSASRRRCKPGSPSARSSPASTSGSAPRPI